MPASTRLRRTSPRRSPRTEESPRSPSATGDLQSWRSPCGASPWRPPGSALPTHSPAATTRSTPLFEIRHWQKTWQTLESVTLALARAGRTEHAAVILGHLDAHSPGFGLEHELHFRDRARELVEADGGHDAAKLRGAQMSADELVTYALAYCSADPTSD